MRTEIKNTEMSIERIKEGPKIDYREDIDKDICETLERLLDNLAYSFFPQRRLRELLKRWLLFYYMTEDKNMKSLEVVDETPQITLYNPLAGSLAMLKTLAIFKMLKLDRILHFSFVISIAAIFYGLAMYLIAGKNSGASTAFLIAFPIGSFLFFIYMRGQDLQDNKNRNFRIFIFLIVYIILFILMWLKFLLK